MKKLVLKLRSKKKRKRGFTHSLPEHPPRVFDRKPPTAVPRSFSLSSIIDQTLTRLIKSNKRAYLAPQREGERARFVVHPSQAGGCSRKLALSIVYDGVGVPTHNARIQRIFDNGHGVHQRLQGYLWEAAKMGTGGLKMMWEDVALFIPELLVTGELDCVVQVARSFYVVEIKSANKETFEALRKPKDEWINQVYLYMAALGIKAAIVLVECKDNQQLKEFYVPWDPPTWDRIHDKVTTVLQAIYRKKLPKAKRCNDCFFCDFKDFCDVQEDHPRRVDWKLIENIDWDSFEGVQP